MNSRRKIIWSIVCDGYSKKPMYPFGRIMKISSKIECLKQQGFIGEANTLRNNLEKYKNDISLALYKMAKC